MCGGGKELGLELRDLGEGYLHAGLAFQSVHLWVGSAWGQGWGGWHWTLRCPTERMSTFMGGMVEIGMASRS